jgi:hypothetical protein
MWQQQTVGWQKTAIQSAVHHGVKIAGDILRQPCLVPAKRGYGEIGTAAA